MLNIGSQSTGAGAGKVTFNPFSITRKIDRSSPHLFEHGLLRHAVRRRRARAAQVLRRRPAGQIYLVFVFKLVAVKTISWSYDDESPKETMTFEYGGLQVLYMPAEAGRQMDTASPGGWNRVKNVATIQYSAANHSSKA